LERLGKHGIPISVNNKINKNWKDLAKSKLDVKKVKDKNGLHWVLVNSRFLYGYEIINAFNTTYQGLSPRGLFYQDSVFWVATYAGIFHNGKNLCSGVEKCYSNTNFLSENNQIYFGGGNHLIKYDIDNEIFDTLINKTFFGQYNEISSVQKTENQFLIGSSKGLYVYDNNQRNQILENTEIHSIKLYEDTFYVAAQNGIHLLPDNDDNLNIVRSINFEGPIEVFPIKDQLFITSFAGLWVVRDNKLENIFANTPYKDIQTVAIIDDDYGNLWISTEMGILLYNPTNKRINHFLDKYEFNRRSYLKVGEHIYFGGIQGLVSFDPTEINNWVRVLGENLNQKSDSSNINLIWLSLFGTIVVISILVRYILVYRKDDKLYRSLSSSDIDQSPIKVEDIEDFIRENLDTINVDQIRFATGLTRYTFYKRFEAVYGKSPKELIKELQEQPNRRFKPKNSK
jgi:hypothetical protein